MKVAHIIIGLSTFGIIAFIAGTFIFTDFVPTYKRERAVNILRTYTSKQSAQEKYNVILKAAALSGSRLSAQQASASNELTCAILFRKIDDIFEPGRALTEDKYDLALTYSAQFKFAGCGIPEKTINSSR